MVKQATRETYTYYEPDGTVRVVRDAPLAGRGKAWVDGAYDPPLYPSALNVRVGEAGIKVSTVIKWLRFYDNDADRVLAAYHPSLTREDVDAAVTYYEANREEIDRKIELEHSPE